VAGGVDRRRPVARQAPGVRAQDSGIPWDDLSGKRLRAWLNLTNQQFYDPNLVSLLPMDFYYPGKGKSGDLPPRKDFARTWHPQILAEMPNVKLIVLIGAYAQKYYLKEKSKSNLTETVRSYKDYLPEFLILVHPSPLNARWLKKNPWFEESLIPNAKKLIKKVLA
jgi:uracil-DNA glycosylase